VIRLPTGNSEAWRGVIDKKIFISAAAIPGAEHLIILMGECPRAREAGQQAVEKSRVS
jgi:hypothetical protein